MVAIRGRRVQDEGGVLPPRGSALGGLIAKSGLIAGLWQCGGGNEGVRLPGLVCHNQKAHQSKISQTSLISFATVNVL